MPRDLTGWTCVLLGECEWGECEWSMNRWLELRVVGVAISLSGGRFCALYSLSLVPRLPWAGCKAYNEALSLSVETSPMCLHGGTNLVLLPRKFEYDKACMCRSHRFQESTHVGSGYCMTRTSGSRNSDVFITYRWRLIRLPSSPLIEPHIGLIAGCVLTLPGFFGTVYMHLRGHSACVGSIVYRASTNRRIELVKWVKVWHYWDLCMIRELSFHALLPGYTVYVRLYCCCGCNPVGGGYYW